MQKVNLEKKKQIQWGYEGKPTPEPQKKDERVTGNVMRKNVTLK